MTKITSSLWGDGVVVRVVAEKETMSDDEDKPALIGKIKDKLISSKQEWAKEGRLLTGMPDEQHKNRLPPGQKEVWNWPVLDLGVQPNIVPPRASLWVRYNFGAR